MDHQEYLMQKAIIERLDIMIEQNNLIIKLMNEEPTEENEDNELFERPSEKFNKEEAEKGTIENVPEKKFKVK